MTQGQVLSYAEAEAVFIARYERHIGTLGVAVYLMLIFHSDLDTGHCPLSVEQVSEMLGIEREVVAKVVPRLVKEGLIARVWHVDGSLRMRLLGV